MSAMKWNVIARRSSQRGTYVLQRRMLHISVPYGSHLLIPRRRWRVAELVAEDQVGQVVYEGSDEGQARQRFDDTAA
jgi:hypothetical protein